MMKLMKRGFGILLLVCASVLCLPMQMSVYAEKDYRLVIEDRADLLSDEEETKLETVMQPLTAYGHIMFMTTLHTRYSRTDQFARNYYHEQFGTESGTLFLIDMEHRQLYIFSDGANYGIITKSKAETITDNVFRMARDENYYGCAEEAFIEIHKLLNGDKIAQPMKYASNAVLAMIIALLINFGIIKRVSMTRKAEDKQLLALAEVHFDGRPEAPVYTHETKIYNPRSSDSGSSSGGSSGGGGGGGGFSGGFSGGGGGHGF